MSKQESGVEISQIDHLKFVLLWVTSLGNLPTQCNITPASPTDVEFRVYGAAVYSPDGEGTESTNDMASK